MDLNESNIFDAGKTQPSELSLIFLSHFLGQKNMDNVILRKLVCRRIAECKALGNDF